MDTVITEEYIIKPEKYLNVILNIFLRRHRITMLLALTCIFQICRTIRQQIPLYRKKSRVRRELDCHTSDRRKTGTLHHDTDKIRRFCPKKPSAYIGRQIYVEYTARFHTRLRFIHPVRKLAQHSNIEANVSEITSKILTLPIDPVNIIE